MDVWKELRRFTEARGLDTVETSLLGDVPWSIKDGVGVSHIPAWLAADAMKNGFEIVAADWKRDVYTLKRSATLRTGPLSRCLFADAPGSPVGHVARPVVRTPSGSGGHAVHEDAVCHRQRWLPQVCTGGEASEVRWLHHGSAFSLDAPASGMPAGL